MTDTTQPVQASWSLLQKISFRFFFVYILLQTAPLGWFYRIPIASIIPRYYYEAVYELVAIFNKYVYHIPATTIVNNGSGDTSQSWEEFFTFWLLAAFASIIWSFLDRRRKSYHQASY